MLAEIWEEKYAPRKIEDMIMPNRLKSYFLDQVKNKNIKSAIFYGPPGTGKTTTSKLLPKALGIPHIYLNAAEHGSVDDIRNTIEPFACNMGFDSGFGRICIIDEADSLSLNAINMLKHVYDKSIKLGCRYIFITNHIAKIIDAIDSRCIPVNFAMNLDEKREVSKEIVSRMHHIFKNEQIAFDQKHLNMLIADYAPDFRAITNRAERMSIDGKFDYSFYIENKRKIYELLDNIVYQQDFVSLVQWLEDHSYIEHTNLIYQIEREMRLLLEKCPRDERGVIASVIAVMSEYESRLTQVKNGVITLKAMFIDLFNLELGKVCTIKFPDN